MSERQKARKKERKNERTNAELGKTKNQGQIS